MRVTGAALLGIEAPKRIPFVVQLGKFAKFVETASHLPPDTVTGPLNPTVMVPAELSVKDTEAIWVVGAVPNPLSS